jgi:hypothetical protein
MRSFFDTWPNLALRRASFCKIALLAAFLLAIGGTALHAQPGYTGNHTKPIGNINFGKGNSDAQSSGPRERVLRGKVVDKNDAPVKGALVYLKESGKSASVKTVVTDETGTYRFVQLAQNVDYEFWAENETDKKKSASKAISSFDNRMEMVTNLKLDEAQPAKTTPKEPSGAPAKP